MVLPSGMVTSFLAALTVYQKVNQNLHREGDQQLRTEGFAGPNSDPTACSLNKNMQRPIQFPGSINASEVTSGNSLRALGYLFI